jgi:hypothetical protein
MSARPPIGVSRRRFSSVEGFAKRVSMPRIGKLRLGIKDVARSGNEFPKEIDYFRCDPDPHINPEERKKILEKFAAVYGDRPTVLSNVFFPNDDKSFVIPHPIEWWAQGKNGAKLMCQGDGVEATRLNIETGDWQTRHCNQVAECAEWNAGKCGLKARLRIFIPNVTVSGYWQVDTSSQYGVGNILDVVNHMMTMFGQLTSIPLVLSREPEPITFEGKTTTHYILHLRAPNLDLQEFRTLVSRNQLSLPPADIDLEEPDVDVPEEIVADSVQEEPADPEVLAKIKLGFDALGTKDVDRATALHTYKGREQVLLDSINKRVADRKQKEAKAS